MMARACRRCGAELVPLEELAELAQVVAGDVARARRGLEGMRLALPQVLVDAVRNLDRDAPQLAAALACHAGRCAPRAA